MFISAELLDRLEAGRFVPERRPRLAPLTMADRRDQVSPLSIAKRCVPYEPLVFFTRHAEVVALARALNHPDKRLLVLTGSTGVGKSALARAGVELLGGGPEQLLWLDWSPPTDPEWALASLLEDLSRYCRQQSGPEALPERPTLPDLLQALQRLSGRPLLVVIDHGDTLVTPEGRLGPRLLRECLNALLSCAQLKLMLVGRLPPAGDLDPQSPGLWHHVVRPLPWAEASRLLPGGLPLPNALVTPLIQVLAPTPGWLRLVGQLLKAHPEEADRLAETFREQPTAPPETWLIPWLTPMMTPQERALLRVLALVRHPVTLGLLAQWLPRTLPTAIPELVHEGVSPVTTLRQLCQSPRLRHLLRRTLDPHRILAETPDGQPERLPSHEARWALASLSLADNLRASVAVDCPPAIREGLHASLEARYLDDLRLVRREDRLLPWPSRLLLAEAAHHASLSPHPVLDDTTWSLPGQVYRAQVPTQPPVPQRSLWER